MAWLWWTLGTFAFVFAFAAFVVLAVYSILCFLIWREGIKYCGEEKTLWDFFKTFFGAFADWYRVEFNRYNNEEK